MRTSLCDDAIELADRSQLVALELPTVGIGPESAVCETSAPSHFADATAVPLNTAPTGAFEGTLIVAFNVFSCPASIDPMSGQVTVSPEMLLGGGSAAVIVVPVGPVTVSTTLTLVSVQAAMFGTVTAYWKLPFGNTMPVDASTCRLAS